MSIFLDSKKAFIRGSVGPRGVADNNPQDVKNVKFAFKLLHDIARIIPIGYQVPRSFLDYPEINSFNLDSGVANDVFVSVVRKFVLAHYSQQSKELPNIAFLQPWDSASYDLMKSAGDALKLLAKPICQNVASSLSKTAFNIGEKTAMKLNIAYMSTLIAGATGMIPVLGSPLSTTEQTFQIYKTDSLDQEISNDSARQYNILLNDFRRIYTEKSAQSLALLFNSYGGADAENNFKRCMQMTDDDFNSFQRELLDEYSAKKENQGFKDQIRAQEDRINTLKAEHKKENQGFKDQIRAQGDLINSLKAEQKKDREEMEEIKKMILRKQSSLFSKTKFHLACYSIDRKKLSMLGRRFG